jgi:ketosteroid isomerase-like protein
MKGNLAVHGTETLAAVVTEYYRDIDCQNVERALACFAREATYRRPGYECFNGIESIAAFYRGARVISSGRHTIESVLEKPGEVAVRGSFQGISHTGLPLAVRFADFWRFSGRAVIERQTYFDAPAV